MESGIDTHQELSEAFYFCQDQKLYWFNLKTRKRVWTISSSSTGAKLFSEMFSISNHVSPENQIWKQKSFYLMAHIFLISMFINKR